ncbi:putative papain-like cysteine peptidase superfamily [Helianthus debilis subsp. tardiflorus]
MMFEDKFGAFADVLALQSLAIGSNVSGSVVDAWVHVLNDDPNLSLPGMPRHLFCIHDTMVDWMLSLETDPSGSRVAAFECGLKTSLSGRHHLVDLHDFDMVSVPVMEVDHYYLVVFDFEDDRIYLIDHLGEWGLVCF